MKTLIASLILATATVSGALAAGPAPQTDNGIANAKDLEVRLNQRYADTSDRTFFSSGIAYTVQTDNGVANAKDLEVRLNQRYADTSDGTFFSRSTVGPAPQSDNGIDAIALNQVLFGSI